MRGVANRLQADLDGLTCPVRPWIDPEAGLGYFEYFEGVGSDSDPLPARGTTLAQVSVSNVYGDLDDALAFTVHSKNTPLRGAHGATPIESDAAEIVWFTRFDDRDGDGIPGRGEVTLYRRVLLILPRYALTGAIYTTTYSGAFGYNNALDALLLHYRTSDISLRVQPRVDASTNVVTYSLQVNSLSDLTKRENRFGHPPSQPLWNTTSSSMVDGAFPHTLTRRLLVPRGTVLTTGTDGQPGFVGVDDNLDSPANPDDVWETGWFGSDDVSNANLTTVAGAGSDVILSELLAFDVRAFDPTAEVRNNNGEAVVPGDPGWRNGTSFAPAARGAFVDLNYANPPGNGASLPTTNPNVDPWAINDSRRWSYFSGLPAFRDSNSDGAWDSTEHFLGTSNRWWTHGTSYCTWSTHYERDGIDQDVDGVVDQGTDGVDNAASGYPSGVNGVDDVGERETSPPYPVPLRGIQVKIRVYEPDTRQLRQMTVVADFTPE